MILVCIVPFFCIVIQGTSVVEPKPFYGSDFGKVSAPDPYPIKLRFSNENFVQNFAFLMSEAALLAKSSHYIF